MLIIKILLLGISGAFFSLILKEQKQTLGVLISVLTACTVLFLILPELEKIISYEKVLYNASGGRDMYIDTSFGYGTMPKYYAQKILEKHGTDRVLFGTDTPWHSVEMELDLLNTLELDNAEMEKITGQMGLPAGIPGLF